MKLVTCQSGKPGKGGKDDILGPGNLYPIALRARTWSNEELLVTVLLCSTVQVILEERIDAILVHRREAQLLLYRHGELEPRSTSGVARMMRKRGGNSGLGRRREKGGSDGTSEPAPSLERLVSILDGSPE